jgi:hypothetical protein
MEHNCAAETTGSISTFCFCGLSEKIFHPEERKGRRDELVSNEADGADITTMHLEQAANE